MRNEKGQFIKGHITILSEVARKKISEKVSGNKNHFWGNPAWNKGTKGIMKPNSGSFKKGDFLGSKHPNWKGGKKIPKSGYIRIYKPGHPFCTSDKCVREHRLVMEKILGRYLKPEERVHHKNGIRDDNRPENLMLYVSNKNWHPCLCPKCGFEFLIK